MRGRYPYYCPKCGYYEECPTKQDWKLAKHHHRLDKCGLAYAPLDGGFVLARGELAEAMRQEYDELARRRQDGS